MTLLCFATLVERPSILVSSTDKRLLMATYVPHAASTADITADAMGITSVDISSSITPHRLSHEVRDGPVLVVADRLGHLHAHV